MARFMILGDLHLSDRPPSLRRASYCEEILDKVAFAVDYASTHQCDAIVSAGDVMHIKSPSRTSHRLVQATHEVLTAAHLPVIIVPGNHDMQHDRIESLAAQPLGALGRMEGIEILTGAHESLPLFGLPYPRDLASVVPTLENDWKPFADRVRMLDDGFPLLVTHCPIFPKGQEPPYDFIAADNWAEFMEAGACYYGHIHDQHGAYVPAPNSPVIMCNNGALSRGSLHEETLKRAPLVTVFDSSKSGLAMFEAVPVPHLPAAEVFALAAKAEQDADEQKMADFLLGLGEEIVQAQSMEQVAYHLGEYGTLSPTAREKALELVEWAMSS